MNWDRIQTNWKQYKTSVRETFAKLTDDDLEKIDGRRDQFLGKLQERYGYSHDIAEQKLTDFTAKMGPASPNKDRAGASGGGTATPRKGDKH
jgi:uncharacterized protein YjbJ (UPF0337 family)